VSKGFLEIFGGWPTFQVVVHFCLYNAACCCSFVLFARPGPNSPIDWIRACVEHLVPDAASPNRRKILLGLNFYGNDYVFGGGGPIIGSQ